MLSSLTTMSFSLLFFSFLSLLILQKARSDENFKSDADAEGTSPRSIITERSVDVAYASYIIKIPDTGSITSASATAEDSKLTESSQAAALVEIIDNSHTKIQRSAIPTPSRCSTLRAAAAPFQPAAMDVRSRLKDKDRGRGCLGSPQSNQSQDQDHDRNSAQEGSLISSNVRTAPVAVLKEISPARVIDTDATPLTSLPSLPGGVNGALTQRLAPHNTVTALNTATATITTTAAAATATGIAPTQLATKQRSHPVNTSLNISSTSSSQKSNGSKGKLSHSTLNSSAVSTASTSAELLHKKESNRAFFYESEKSDNNRSNSNQERRSSGSSNSNSNNNSNRGNEEWDAAMEAEVTEASEHVWRQVEKWIEAEAMAEEAAWNVLVLGHDNEDEERYLGEESDCTEEEFKTKPPESETGNMSPGDTTLPRPDKYKNKNRLSNKSDQSSSLENDNTNSKSNSKSNSSGAVINGQPNFQNFSLSIDKMFNATSLSSSALSVIATPSTATMTRSMHSCSTVTYESPRSSSPAADSTVSGISKFLHNKLSAPDRRRAASPTEVRRKQEAKQHSAESNRDKTVAERRQKALLVSDRAKIRGINEQKRLNLAESALEERLRDAEKRHEECIKVIKLRAGNENTKVSEVMFINNMNAEGIVDQLRQKLVEVEARVLAAVMRRQDILTGITARQRKRNNKKVQQMSELRLQLERQKMERWDKLQRRLEAVQVRRQARFLEMQRRSDAQELTRARLASTYYLTKEKEKELIDLSLNGGVKGLAISLTAITSTMNSFKAQLTSPLYNCGTMNPSSSISNSTFTPINTVVENSITIEKKKDKDRDKEKQKEKDKDKDKVAPVVVASAPAPAVSLPASVSLLLSIPHSLPLPLPGSLPTAAITTATASANPVRLRLNTSTTSPSTSENTIKNTASTPNKISGDTVNRVKSKNGHGSIKTATAVVATRPVKSSSRPFITSLKSPSVSGSAGFFESPNAKVAMTMKSSTTFMRSNSGNNNISNNSSISISNNNNGNNNINNNNSDNNYNNNNNNNNNSNSNSNNKGLQVEVTAADGARGTVLNNRHKAVTARCTTPQRTELRTCTSTELTGLGYPTLSPTESISPNMNHENCATNRPKRSNSLNNDNVDIISAEIKLEKDDSIQAVLLKKKKKGKKKEKVIEKDEEMKLLDLLLSIKEKQKDFGIKSELASNKTHNELNNNNENQNINTRPGVVHISNDLSSRPRTLKHLNSLAKLLKKKQGLKLYREQATRQFSELYDIYLKTAKINFKNNSDLRISDNNDENKSNNENKNETENENKNENVIINNIKEDFNLQYVPNSTVHNLVTFMCENITTLSVGKASTDKIEDYESLKLAIICDVNVVLKKLESELDQRKEIGLFLKKGGNILLRILLGDEIGLLSNRGCCIVGNIEDVTSSGLFMRICRAVNACNLTERARESSFSSGLTYLLSDITLVFSGHLNDWLASSQWSYVGEGKNRRLILSNECQCIPLLFSALTCQLNRTANIIASPDIEASCKAPYFGWIRYLFASGMVSSLCRDIRSMASLYSYASKEVFSYLLLYSLLECVDALCLCVSGMGLEEKAVTTTSSPITITTPIPITIPMLSIDLKGAESIHALTLTSTVTPLPTLISTSTSTSTSVTPPCDTKSKSSCVLIPFTRKDMVYMLLDMHLAPTLVTILDR